MKAALRSRMPMIAFAVLMSACGGSDPATSAPALSGSSTPEADAALAFGPDIVIGADQARFHGGEPSLQIGRSGTLWSTDVGPAQIWKSSDRGSTWTFVAPPLSIGGGDMDAAEDGAGRLHVIDIVEGSINPGTCAFYYRSSDGGHSFDIVRATHGGGMWSDGDGGCASGGKKGSVDRPWVATFGDNTIYLTYIDPAGGGSVDISVDGGQTFSHASIGSFLHPGGMAVDPVDGTLYTAGIEPGVYDRRNVGQWVRVQTWQNGQLVSSSTVFDARQFDAAAGGYFPSVAVDEAHNVYVAWSDNSAGTTDVYVSVSRDRGSTWRTPTRISRNQTVAVYPTIVAGAQGRVALAWYGTSDRATSRGDAAGTSWFVYAAQSTNALDSTPTYSIVKVSDEPFHHNSICRGTAVCEGVATNTGAVPPGYEWGIADFFRMAIDAGGSLVVMWTDTAHPDGPKDHVARQIDGPLLRGSSLPPMLTQKIKDINAFTERRTSTNRSSIISEGELNAYVQQWVRTQRTTLVDPTVTLSGTNRFTVRALLHRGALGRVPLTIAGALATHDGTARLTVESATVGNAPVVDRELERLLDTVFDPARVGIDLRAPFPLPARIRETHIDGKQLVILQ